VTAQQVTSPVPDFTVALQAVLEFIGVSPVLIGALLLAFALESWYSNGKRVARTATVVGGAVARGGGWLAGQRPVRTVVAIATSVTVVIAQVLMVRLSYVGGSIVATPFDPVRWKALDEAYGASPLLFVDPVFLTRFLATDAFTVSYVLVTIVALLRAYRKKAATPGLWLLITTPFWLLLSGSVAIAVLSLALDLLFAGLTLVAGGTYDWRFTTDYILDAPHLTIDLVAGIYCGVALIAVGGAALVRRLWSAAVAEQPA
jgi:hypothetical protein